ncbi:uncharacterized protein LOC141950944 isoform X3 [Strix uralensis]|uniref:uncharacterized protein LOC141950944 isoform X3 n=1 Tax=Strix uralensis TaxID=36305 RepID=UPI003DA1FB7F
MKIQHQIGGTDRRVCASHPPRSRDAFGTVPVTKLGRNRGDAVFAAATGTGDVTPLKLSHAWPRTEAERIGSLEELGCRYQDITSSRGREDTEDGWIPPAPTRLPATSLTGGALQCLARHLGTWSTCACVGSVGKAKQQKTCKTPISLTHGAQNKHRTGWRSSVAMAPRRNAKQATVRTLQPCCVVTQETMA